VLDPQPISGIPPVYTQQLGGLMDIALHPASPKRASCI
jgi:hypothetical protein